MKTPRRRIYLVVRYGLIDEFNAVDELERVVDKHGYAWFGKYGQPLSLEIEKIVSSDTDDVYMTLVRKATITEVPGYVWRTYKVTGISRASPEKSNEYPSYYKATITRIRSWIRVRPTGEPEIDIKKLVTKSSSTPLTQSLGSSMRGHFLCRLW